MGCLMAPTPPNYGRPTGDDGRGWGQAGAPNPVVPPVARRAPQYGGSGLGAPGNVDFSAHVVHAEPPRKKPNKGAMAVAAGIAGVVVLLCCGIAGAQSLGGPEPRVTFTVTHVPAPSTTTHTTTATVTQSPAKKSRDKKDKKAKSTSSPTSIGE